MVSLLLMNLFKIIILFQSLFVNTFNPRPRITNIKVGTKLNKPNKYFKIPTTAYIVSQMKNKILHDETTSTLVENTCQPDQLLFINTVANTFNALVPSFKYQLVNRTNYIDNAVHNFLKVYENMSYDVQVVILGSGLDTRPFRIPGNISWYEIDLDPFVNNKKEILQSTNENHYTLQANYLEEDYIETFIQNNNFDPYKPTLIIWEGNSYYFKQEDIKRIFDYLSSKISEWTIVFDHFVFNGFTFPRLVEAGSVFKSVLILYNLENNYNLKRIDNTKEPASLGSLEYTTLRYDGVFSVNHTSYDTVGIDTTLEEWFMYLLAVMITPR